MRSSITMGVAMPSMAMSGYRVTDAVDALTAHNVTAAAWTTLRG